MLGLLTCTFLVIHLAPGDPTAFFLQSDTDPRYAENLRRAYGLDQPIHIQYVKWLGSTVTGDLGISFSKHAPVASILLETVPKTLLLTSFALLFNFGIGIFLGLYSALRHRTRPDYFISIFALFIYSMPEFWLGLMLILWFALYIPVFPVSGMQSPLADYLPLLEHLWDIVQHMILPVFVLGVASAAATGRWFAASRRTQNVVFLIVVALVLVLTYIGLFARGPYWNLYWPWQEWPHLPTRI